MVRHRNNAIRSFNFKRRHLLLLWSTNVILNGTINEAPISKLQPPISIHRDQLIWFDHCSVYGDQPVEYSPSHTLHTWLPTKQCFQSEPICSTSGRPIKTAQDSFHHDSAMIHSHQSLNRTEFIMEFMNSPIECLVTWSTYMVNEGERNNGYGYSCIYWSCSCSSRSLWISNPRGSDWDYVVKVKVNRKAIGKSLESLVMEMEWNGLHIRMTGITRFKMIPHMAMYRGTHGELWRIYDYGHRVEWEGGWPSYATACSSAVRVHHIWSVKPAAVRSLCGCLLLCHWVQMSIWWTVHVVVFFSCEVLVPNYVIIITDNWPVRSL